MDDFSKIFAADPAGWTAVLLAGLGLLFSAIFWRRTLTVLRWIGGAISGLVRRVRSIRVTTADRLPARAGTPIVPVRWDVTKFKDATTEQFALANFGEGSIARNVRLDIIGGGARLRSAAAWAEINGGNYGEFLMIIEEDGAWRGLSFHIEWTDARGHLQRGSVEVSPR